MHERLFCKLKFENESLIYKTAFIMKKVLFVAVLLSVCFSVTMNAQTKKEERAAKRAALKKEREARKAIEAQMVIYNYLTFIFPWYYLYVLYL